MVSTFGGRLHLQRRKDPGEERIPQEPPTAGCRLSSRRFPGKTTLADRERRFFYSEIIDEVAASKTTERGTRADDKRSETAMEDRKKAGYF